MILRLVSSGDDRALTIRDHLVSLVRNSGDIEVQRDSVRLISRAIRFSENVVADIREWTSTWGRRALDFGGRAGYHDFNQI